MAKQKPAHEIRLGRVKATIWANAESSPTLPGKTTTIKSGKRLSVPSCHTGTPGIICPAIMARRTFSALVATSLEVMPPLAMKGRAKWTSVNSAPGS